MSKKVIRCAIYTRKSSEEGLEQDFNSLDAQREACEAYIKSQVHEGWTLVEKQYNDGGFSGGTLERPALKQLLVDIESGKIDIVVVYKVDRLTRSLMDFSKIVELFDSHETSFVSITQHFNTTTSMGRLTLNILLSFAQFEREVTGERIRDKFAASKKKGMWVNGIAPMGYINEKGKLIPDEKNAEIIQHIFEKYIELTSVAKLQESLKEENVFTRTGKPFSKGHLYKILSNKTYIGKIEHKQNVYDGLHEAIIDADIFEKTRKILVTNSINRQNPNNTKSSSLLAGKIFDDKNNYLSPSHSNTRGKRYRYYVNQVKIQNRLQDLGSVTKIPANEIEKFVRSEITQFINKNENIQEYLKNYPITKQKELLKTSAEIKPSDIIIRTILHKVVVYKNKVEIIFCENTLVKAIEATAYGTDLPIEKSRSDNLIMITKNIKLAKADNGAKLIIGGSESTPNHNMALIQAIVKSFYYHKELEEGRLSREDKNSSYVKKIMELRYLPPKIIEDIMNGRQEKDLTVSKLMSL